MDDDLYVWIKQISQSLFILTWPPIESWCFYCSLFCSWYRCRGRSPSNKQNSMLRGTSSMTSRPSRSGSISSCRCWCAIRFWCWFGWASMPSSSCEDRRRRDADRMTLVEVLEELCFVHALFYCSWIICSCFGVSYALRRRRMSM